MSPNDSDNDIANLADYEKTHLVVWTAPGFPLRKCGKKDPGCVVEIEAALSKAPGAFALVPLKAGEL